MTLTNHALSRGIISGRPTWNSIKVSTPILTLKYACGGRFVRHSATDAGWRRCPFWTMAFRSRT